MPGVNSLRYIICVSCWILRKKKKKRWVASKGKIHFFLSITGQIRGLKFEYSSIGLVFVLCRSSSKLIIKIL